MPHWHILGAGSIGCLWACKLLQSGFDCSLLLRPETFDRQGASRLDLTCIENGIKNIHSVETVAADRSGTIHNLILTTKAFDAVSAIQSISSQLSPDAAIILLQNGMGSQQAVSDLLPNHTVFAGSTTDGAWLDGFLKIQRAGKGKTWLGAFSPKAYEQGSSAIEHLLTLQNMDIEFTRLIHEKLQEKLAINSVINGLTVLYNCQNGELLKPDIQPQIRQLCYETELILRTSGYRKTLNLFDQVVTVLTVTSDNFSSTLQDVRKQRKTELPWINGYLLKQAKEHGLSAPAHTDLMRKLTAIGVR